MTSAQAVPAYRRDHRLGRPIGLLARPGDDRHQRRQRQCAFRVQLQFERPAGDPVVPVRCGFLLCAAYPLQKNEHVRIDVLSGKFSPRPGRHRHHRHRLLPPAHGDRGLSGCRCRWSPSPKIREYFGQRRRPHPLAGQAVLLPIGFTLLALQRDFRTHQARRLPGRSHRRPQRQTQGTDPGRRTGRRDLQPKAPPPKPGGQIMEWVIANMAP